jgi:hypothetical protein
MWALAGWLSASAAAVGVGDVFALALGFGEGLGEGDGDGLACDTIVAIATGPRVACTIGVTTGKPPAGVE